MPGVADKDFIPHPHACEILETEVEDRESCSDESSEEGDIANESTYGFIKAKKQGPVQKICRKHTKKC